MSTYSKHDDISDMENTQEVIYSEGAPFEEYQCPNDTWDSDDSVYEEDNSSKTGWIYGLNNLDIPLSKKTHQFIGRVVKHTVYNILLKKSILCEYHI